MLSLLLMLCVFVHIAYYDFRRTTDVTVSNHNDVFKWKHFPLYWPFVKGIPGHRWIPLIEAGDAELWYFIWAEPKQTVEQAIEAPVIWDVIALIVTLL